MALTRDYKESIRHRAERDPDYAVSLLQEAFITFLEGEPEAARIILRELVNSTMDLKVAEVLGKSSKSIHRMLSPQSNPTMDNLASILVALLKGIDKDLEVVLTSHKKKPKPPDRRRLI